MKKKLSIEIEVHSLEDFDAAAGSGADILLLDRFHTIADAREAEERLRVVYGEEVTSRLDGQAPKRAAAG